MAAPRWTGLATFGSVFLRLALGISFLSAVADRFGLWGVYGQPNVGWGNYARFVDYTATLNWFLPAWTNCFGGIGRGYDRAATPPEPGVHSRARGLRRRRRRSSHKPRR